MKTSKAYETRPFKVAYVIYGEALIFATNQQTAKMKLHGMTTRHLVEKSLMTDREVIDTEAEKVEATV
jgi:hypothetical protein